MSTYYSFYIGKRNRETGDTEALGPYIKQDGVFCLNSVFERSSSFIEWDEFCSYSIKADKLNGDIVDKATIDNGVRKLSIAQWVPFDELSDEDIVTRGYSSIGDITRLVRSNYNIDLINWEIAEPLPAEAYAEMSQKEKDMYGHVAFVNTNSFIYISRILKEIVSKWYYRDYLDDAKEELGFIVVVG